MRYLFSTPFFLLFLTSVYSQTNITITNPLADAVLKGNYNPLNFVPPVIINKHGDILCGLKNEISSDSLHSYLLQLSSFHNRNTGSDTVSSTTGIGAARRWAFGKFQNYSAWNNNRLLPSYLQFDQMICNVTQHRDIFAVLPGSDTSDYSIVIIEAHIDSRCEGLCDSLCEAHGMEDNGSGTALVLELARVMSKYYFKNTIVFLITIGEEQGLYGANAFAVYSANNGLKIKAVQNNDIVGGVICGKTSSPPSCIGENTVDSMQVRIFSHGSFTARNRSYARFIKLVNNEKLTPVVQVPMTVNIMNQEDRGGRGGDHQPFRQNGFTAVRFTSSHEHGDANVSDTAYTDRQHTIRDLLGVDKNLDGVIDSFFVDFNYLKRNTVLNGAAAALAALGPATPDFQLINDTNGVKVTITTQIQYPQYRVGVTTVTGGFFEALYRFSGTQFILPAMQAGKTHFVCVASLDSNGITSIFSKQLLVNPVVTTASGTTDNLPYSVSCQGTQIIEKNNAKYPGIELLTCQPNPTSNTTLITVTSDVRKNYENAEIVISDVQGRVLRRFRIDINQPAVSVSYEHLQPGSSVLVYSLVMNGDVVKTRRMVVLKK